MCSLLENRLQACSLIPATPSSMFVRLLRPQEKLSFTFVLLHRNITSSQTIAQSTATCSVHGTTFTSDTACILSLVEEDGELKILQAKTFSDPQQHTAIDSLIAVAKGAAVA